MIELYAKGTTDFSRHGIALAASQAAVTYQENGRFDMDLTMPVNAAITIDYGMIVRCPVPVQDIGAITLGPISYWEISAGLTDVPLYAQVPKKSKVSYANWKAYRSYMAGDKVTYGEDEEDPKTLKNWQCTTGHGGLSTPPPSNPTLWRQISGTKTTSKVITTLDAGAILIKTGDLNATYMKVVDTQGREGFVEIAKCTDRSESGTRVVPAQHIETQSFVITEITKASDGKTVAIHAEHISYQLARTMLGDCVLSRATPSTALMIIRGAMRESYPGAVETNLTGEDALISGDFSWKNAQAAILDPKAGLLQAMGARLIRNDLDVYVIAPGEAVPKYRITYGTNLKAVKWDGDVSGLVTRIYPIAQNEDGSTLLLPEEYIDTVRTVPYVRPEALQTGLKVGAKEEQEDGSEIVLDESTVFTRMREAAANRFSIDEADKATVTLEVDWLHLPDTAEFSAYAALRNAAPGEWVQVKNGPLGIDTVIALTGYTFDPILRRYTKGTFGKKKQTSSVASYDIQSGAVTGRAIGVGAVGSQNIQANSITAREIEANAITADKIASRSIITELLAAGSITADEILAGSVTAEKIAAYAITAEKIAAGAITAQAIDSEVITSRHIAADAITTEKIAAGAVEASKIAALAITTEKLAAGAVVADKIAAGAISAGKIDTTDLAAINATLGTAAIADARIQLADIDFAKVKDLNAESAYFGQAVIQEGLANKLFIPRLSVDYAQIVSATIGDLVIQASDENYYRLDVALDGSVTATQVTPSQAEIDAGHTNDGRTIYTANDITASELNTTNIYASHALMDNITAAVINTDQLFAREATISKINALDLSSNTYIQSVVGNWQSQSTITQTVDGINSRITSLGYGTFFYSTTEPDPSGVVVGDVWIEPIDDNTWNDISNYTWDDLSGMTWDQVAGQYRMYVWTGEQWKLLYDNLIISGLQTQINQNAYAITLKADASTVDLLSDEVTDFAATLEVQAQQISAAVSSVTSKTSNYTRLTDPADDPAITLSEGDTWTKAAGNGTWGAIEGYTWDELSALTWDELAGASVYTWDGSGWIQTADYGAVVQNRTLIEATDRQITLLAEEQTIIGGTVSRLSASITILADRITQEVERATNAEDGKIAKTTQYQTADEIVSEAVSQATTSAAGLYMAKTTAYQTPDSIVTEAVRQSASAASGAYLAKTAQYQTADSIVSAAQSYVNGQLASYSTTTQTNSLISAYVTNNAYKIQSGVAITAEGVTISGGKYIKIESSGTFDVTASTFGIRSASSAAYAIWAGASAAASSPFRVKPDGTVYLTKLIAINEQGAESEVNLRTTGLWKLGYATIKALTVDSSGYCTSMTFSNAISGSATVNFKSAAGARIVSAALGTRDTSTKATFGVLLTQADGASYTVSGLNCIAAYNLGWLAARDHQTTIGTCYEITAHQGDWVQVRSLGTGYSRVGATPQ